MEHLHDQLETHKNGIGAFLCLFLLVVTSHTGPRKAGLQSLRVPSSLILHVWICAFAQRSGERPDVDETTDFVAQLQPYGLLEAQVGDLYVLANVVASTISMSQ